MKPIRSTPAQRAILGSIVCLALSISLPSAAQPAAGSTVSAPQTLEQANAQRLQAKQMQDSAEKNLVAEQAACYKKFLVNSCLEDAKKKYTNTVIEARQLDQPARDFQREHKRAEVEAKEKQRASDNAQRAIDQQQQATDYRNKEAERAAERERKKAAKAEKAAAGRAKRAEEEAQRQKKNEERARRDAQRAERKAQREAKEAAAAKAPPP